MNDISYLMHHHILHSFMNIFVVLAHARLILGGCFGLELLSILDICYFSSILPDIFLGNV